MREFNGNQWGVSDPVARFWAKVDRRGESDCWEWRGPRNPHGYGSFSLPGTVVMAHRYAFELANGRSPGAFHVCHRCDNPSCVNPAHLFLGTRKDNMQDASRKGRIGRKPGFRGLSGEQHPMAKLTAAAARSLKQRALAGERYSVLARAFGVSVGHVSCIARGLAWKELA